MWLIQQYNIFKRLRLTTCKNNNTLKDFIWKKNDSGNAIAVISMSLVFHYLFYIEDKEIEHEDAKGTV